MKVDNNNALATDGDLDGSKAMQQGLRWEAEGRMWFENSDIFEILVVSAYSRENTWI